MYRNHFFMSLLLRAKTQPERTHYSTQKQTLNSFSSTASFSIATQTSSYKGYSMKAFFKRHFDKLQCKPFHCQGAAICHCHTVKAVTLESSRAITHFISNTCSFPTTTSQVSAGRKAYTNSAISH